MAKYKDRGDLDLHLAKKTRSKQFLCITHTCSFYEHFSDFSRYFDFGAPNFGACHLG